MREDEFNFIVGIACILVAVLFLGVWLYTFQYWSIGNYADLMFLVVLLGGIGGILQSGEIGRPLQSLIVFVLGVTCVVTGIVLMIIRFKM